MTKSEAEFILGEHRHLLCKMFEHNNTRAQMKLTFLEVDKDSETGKYKVNCFADGTYGHIIEDLDYFMASYSPMRNGYFQ